MIFHRLGQAVKRIMANRYGFHNIVVYLDDFLIVESSYERCVEGQLVLMSLLVRLGFQISWKKVTSVSQRVEFLGVVIDSTECTASLSKDKLSKLHKKLCEFDGKCRATKRQLQSLAGSLNWACQVIRGGRFFLRRILDCIVKLNMASHKCKLDAEFKKDLDWWLDYMCKFNGVVYYREANSVVIHSDACNEGAGVFVQGKWRYIHWKKDIPKADSLHINNKEVLAAIVGVKHWAQELAGCDVTIVTDSTAAKGILNKGRSKNKYIMSQLRHLFWVITEFNIRLRAVHCPGVLNQIPDAISRLHENGQALRLQSLLRNWSHCSAMGSFYNMCESSMSPRALQVIQPQLVRWSSRLS